MRRALFGDHTRVVKYINFDYARGADGTQVLISNNENISNVLLYHMIEDFDLSNYGYARHFKFLKEKTVIVPDKEVSSKFETQLCYSWVEQTLPDSNVGRIVECGFSFNIPRFIFLSGYLFIR